MATQNSWAVERDVAACSDDNTRNLHTNTTGLGRNFPSALDAAIGLWAKSGGAVSPPANGPAAAGDLTWIMPTTALVRRTESSRVHFAFQMFREGGATYRIAAALPMPDRLIWSVAICDALTGEEVCFDRAAASAVFEVKDGSVTSCPKAHLGPIVPNGARHHWIKTLAGRGWFTYRRLGVSDSPRAISIRSRPSMALGRTPG